MVDRDSYFKVLGLAIFWLSVRFTLQLSNSRICAIILGSDKMHWLYLLMRCKTMAASYKKLFKLLIDRDMKKKELAEKAGISIATITKMGKDGAVVSSDVLVKICTALECTMDDIVEIVPEKNS